MFWRWPRHACRCIWVCTRVFSRVCSHCTNQNIFVRKQFRVLALGGVDSNCCAQRGLTASVERLHPSALHLTAGDTLYRRLEDRAAKCGDRSRICLCARTHTQTHTHTHTQTHTSKQFGLSLRFHAHYCVLAQNISEGISKRKKAEASTRSHVICIGGRPAEQKDSRVRGEAGRRRRRV